MNADLTRVTVNLTRRAMDALEFVAAKNSGSKTDTINRAVQVYELVERLLDEDGGRLRVIRADGSVVEVRIL